MRSSEMWTRTAGTSESDSFPPRGARPEAGTLILAEATRLRVETPVTWSEDRAQRRRDLLVAIPLLVVLGAGYSLLVRSRFGTFAGAFSLALAGVVAIAAFTVREARYEVSDAGVRITRGVRTRTYAWSTFRLWDGGASRGKVRRGRTPPSGCIRLHFRRPWRTFVALYPPFGVDGRVEAVVRRALPYRDVWVVLPEAIVYTAVALLLAAFLLVMLILS